jgi:ferric-dicitrate binding protein FerR (iron transport regulator)
MLHQNDEELLADESFINYCLGLNEADILKWEKALREDPSESPRIEELRALVLLTSRGVQNIELKNQIAELGRRIDIAEEAVAITGSASRNRSVTRALVAAAACLVLITGAAIFYFAGTTRTYPLSYATKPAEKKSFVLPDGSKVILNAGSRLSVDAGFGEKERRIHLDGEAFFDVAHNASKPFIVQTSRMDVKVLGTAFNVKAYTADDLFETSLIRGSIELSLKKEHKTVMLHPHEKYVLRETRPETATAVASHPVSSRAGAQGLVPVKISKMDTSIVEVSWTENKLAFMDEPFGDILKKLERWYGIHITVTDPSLMDNLYTGSFRNESIDDVLSALQFSKPFTYKKQGDDIIISR